MTHRTQPTMEQFRALSERALAGAKAAPQLVGVTPVMDRGWVLEYELSGSGGRVSINALIDSSAATTLDYSYRTPEDPDPRRARRLGHAGLLLCRALARVRPDFELEPPREDDAPQLEVLGLYLASVCDRGCVFCSWTHFEGKGAKRGPGGVRLPVTMADIEKHDFVKGLNLEEVEAELRAHAYEAASHRVGWSGPDCLSSPYFDDAVRLAHRLGYREMNIQTPGSRLLEPGFVDFLLQHSVTDVSLTAHAHSEARFDRVGGKVGAYRLFWDAVELLLERGFTLRYEVPCIAETVDELPAHLANLARYPGALTVFYWYPSPDMLRFFPSMGVPFVRAVDALDQAREKLEPKRVTVDGLPLCVVPPQLAAHYDWTYSHMKFFDCERLDICASCSLRADCPGAAPVYLANHGWPAHAQPVE